LLCQAVRPGDFISPRVLRINFSPRGLEYEISSVRTMEHGVAG
jgi:hypothetical protein